MIWQPIETAPKDGTVLVLWCSENIDRQYASPKSADRFCLGYYGDSNGLYHNEGWWTVESQTEIWGYGGEMTGPMTETECLRCKPTHWFALPPAPEITP